MDPDKTKANLQMLRKFHSMDPKLLHSFIRQTMNDGEITFEFCPWCGERIT